MQALIRTYTAPPEVMEEARPKLADLEQTMRQLPGFAAYYFVETDDGIVTITVTEDEVGTAASMGQAAEWVRHNLTETRAKLSVPQVTQGQAHVAATR